MSRISVESGSQIEVITLLNYLKELGSEVQIEPVELSIGHPPFEKRFLRLFPYEGENFKSQFDLEKYKKARDTLNRFLIGNIGNPNESQGSLVNLTICDYSGKKTRRAILYETNETNRSGLRVYIAPPTRLELQTTVIPRPDDSSLLQLRDYPPATILAIRDGRYILSGRLVFNNIYPPVNDYGEIFALNKLTDEGSYIHYRLNDDNLERFFG